jgi:putative N6-adenine-specific DNA methylase
MKAFYFKLGENLARLRGWRCFILSGNPAFESAFHHRPRSVHTLWNGPIECRLYEYEM